MPGWTSQRFAPHSNHWTWGEPKVIAWLLANLKGLSKLQSLYLSNIRVTDTGLEHLKGSTALQSLAWGEPK